MNVDETVTNVQRKIDREKALINAANAMRQSTNNPAVLSRLDGQIRDGTRNIEYFEGKLRDIEMQRTNTGMDNLSLQPGASAKGANPVTPPPKDGWNGYTGSDQGGYGAAPGGLPRMVPPGGADMGGYFLPEGTTVQTQAYSFHRDPELWPHAEE